MSRANSSRSIAAALCFAFLGVSATQASVLCKTRRGGLLVRDVCKPREETLDTSKLDALGLRGPAGPAGPAGPPGGGLHVVDAVGSDVGAVTSLGSYYGQYAQVLREATLPGGTGPEFITFSVSTRGVRGNAYYGCGTYYGTYFRTPDCSGELLQSCDYGNCSSTAGAFLFMPITVGNDGVGCFTRGGSEFERGDFYRSVSVYGASVEAATTSCTSRGGSVIGSIGSCGPSSFCGQCCQLDQNVGVAPIHTVDMSSVGTPPFRLGR
jgi:hypothetical protein